MLQRKHLVTCLVVLLLLIILVVQNVEKRRGLQHVMVHPAINTALVVET